MVESSAFLWLAHFKSKGLSLWLSEAETVFLSAVAVQQLDGIH